MMLRAIGGTLGEALRALRELRQIMTADEIGLRWVDNIGPVLRFRYLDSRAPMEIDAKDLKTKPQIPIVLRARHRVTGIYESGCRIAWDWRGRYIRIESIDVRDTSAEYDVELGLMRGDE